MFGVISFDRFQMPLVEEYSRCVCCDGPVPSAKRVCRLCRAEMRAEMRYEDAMFGG